MASSESVGWAHPLSTQPGPAISRHSDHHHAALCEDTDVVISRFNFTGSRETTACVADWTPELVQPTQSIGSENHILPWDPMPSLDPSNSTELCGPTGFTWTDLISPIAYNTHGTAGPSPSAFDIFPSGMVLVHVQRSYLVYFTASSSDKL